MVSLRSPSSALSVLLQLAKQHSSNIELHYSALQNMAALSSSNRLRKYHNGPLNKNFIKKKLYSTSSSIHSPNVVLDSSAALSTSSRQIVASLSFWQSQRDEIVNRNMNMFSSIDRRAFSTGANQIKQQKQNVRDLSSLPQVFILYIIYLFYILLII